MKFQRTQSIALAALLVASAFLAFAPGAVAQAEPVEDAVEGAPDTVNATVDGAVATADATASDVIITNAECPDGSSGDLTVNASAQVPDGPLVDTYCFLSVDGGGTTICSTNNLGEVLPETCHYQAPNVAPTVSVSADNTTVFVGQDVTFTLTGSDDYGIDDWAITFGDGNSAAGSNSGQTLSESPTHAYAAADEYQVNVTITDTDGLEASATINVTVEVYVDPNLPAAKLSAAKGEGIAPASVVLTLNGQDAGEIVNWTLDFGDGSEINQTSTGQNFTNGTVTHLYTAAATYTATLSIEDDDGNIDVGTATFELVDPTFTVNLAPNSLDLVEAGASETYTVTLAPVPAADEVVVINVTASSGLTATLGGESFQNLSFNATNAAAGFEIAVLAPADGDEINATENIGHSFNKADSTNASAFIKTTTLDVEVLDIQNDFYDRDGDNVINRDDAFPDDSEEWADTDGDGIGDNADRFPNDSTETSDSDGDNVGDNSDVFPNDATEWADSDNDGIGDNGDLCEGFNDANDIDGDNIPDGCDDDDDNDGFNDTVDQFDNDATRAGDHDADGIDSIDDNCPNTANANQLDMDSDGIGDACDDDMDGDDVNNVNDDFPLDATESVDTDGDGIGNNADTDDDNDGVSDDDEATDGTNPLLKDSDGDGLDDSREKELGTNATDANDPSFAVTDLQVSFDGDDVLVSWVADANAELISHFAVYRHSTPEHLGNVTYVTGQSAYEYRDTAYPGGVHYYSIQPVIDGGPWAFNAAVATTSAFAIPADYFATTCPAGSTDADGDGLCDDAEIDFGTAPDNTDTDGDGLNDLDEINLGTNPTDQNSVGALPTVTEWYAEPWLWVGLALLLAILGVVIYGVVLFVGRPDEADYATA